MFISKIYEVTTIRLTGTLANLLYIISFELLDFIFITFIIMKHEEKIWLYTYGLSEIDTGIAETRPYYRPMLWLEGIAKMLLPERGHVPRHYARPA